MTDIRQEVGTCERCWGKAFTAAYGIGSKTQAGEYERIVASCACTLAQRRGVADSFAEGYAARDKEIEELRARIKELEERIAMRTDLLEQAFSKNDDLSMRIRELEGMVPRWARAKDVFSQENVGRISVRTNCDKDGTSYLMVPPIQLPGEGG